jgi:hypothetical protein
MKDLLTSEDFNCPKIMLSGPIDYSMYANLCIQLDQARKEGLVVTELSMLGGDRMRILS